MFSFGRNIRSPRFYALSGVLFCYLRRPVLFVNFRNLHKLRKHFTRPPPQNGSDPQCIRPICRKILVVHGRFPCARDLGAFCSYLRSDGQTSREDQAARQEVDEPESNPTDSSHCSSPCRYHRVHISLPSNLEPSAIIERNQGRKLHHAGSQDG